MWFADEAGRSGPVIPLTTPDRRLRPLAAKFRDIASAPRDATVIEVRHGPRQVVVLARWAGQTQAGIADTDPLRKTLHRVSVWRPAPEGQGAKSLHKRLNVYLRHRQVYSGETPNLPRVDPIILRSCGGVRRTFAIRSIIGSFARGVATPSMRMAMRWPSSVSTVALPSRSVRPSARSVRYSTPRCTLPVMRPQRVLTALSFGLASVRRPRGFNGDGLLAPDGMIFCVSAPAC